MKSIFSINIDVKKGKQDFLCPKLLKAANNGREKDALDTLFSFAKQSFSIRSYTFLKMIQETSLLENKSVFFMLGKMMYHSSGEVLKECYSISGPILELFLNGKISKSEAVLASAIASAESKFVKGAISPQNARGLLQILPNEAEKICKQKKIGFSSQRLTMDDKYNVIIGLHSLEHNIALSKGNLLFGICYYNSGHKIRLFLDKFRGAKHNDVLTSFILVEFLLSKNCIGYCKKVLESFILFYTCSFQRLPEIEDIIRFQK